MITDTNILVRPGTMADIPAATALTNLVMLDELGTSNMKVEELREQWAQSHFEPERDSVVIYDGDGTLLAMAEMWSSEPYAFPFFWGMVHPEHRGHGYGSRLMAWAEERVQLNLNQVPPDTMVALLGYAQAKNRDIPRLFARHGYVHNRNFYRMQIDLDPDSPPEQPVLPEGVRIRAHVPGQDDYAVWETMEAGFADHWGFTPSPFERFRQNMIEAAHFDPSLWLLAVTDTPDGEKIIGGSLSRNGTMQNPDEGYVMDLVVLRDYRRQGIAMALLKASFSALLEHGTTMVTLSVDADSLTGATRLYEKAGMHIARESHAYEKTIREGKDLRVQTVD